MERIQNSIKVKKPRCPYCHDEFQVEQEKTGCSLCLAWFHQECWNEYGGCTSCKGVRPPKPTETERPALQISVPDSIHHPSANALLSQADRVAARAEGRKGGLAALQVLSPLLIAVLVVFLNQKSPQVRFGIVFFTIFAIVAIYLLASNNFKQSHLRKTLKRRRSENDVI